jgi:hypothetical protein
MKLYTFKFLLLIVLFQTKMSNAQDLDIYFGNNEDIFVGGQVIFKGNLTIENPIIVDFSGSTNAVLNESVEVIGTDTLESAGTFRFENTATKSAKGSFKLDEVFLVTGSNLEFQDITDFRIDDVLHLDGIITTGANNLLTLGESIANVGVLNYTAGYVNGNMKRWFAPTTSSNVLYPFGTPLYYSPAKLSYTTAPNGGSLTGKYNENTNIVYGINLNDNGVLLTNLSGQGFWQFDQTDNLSTGTYSIDLTTNHLFGVVDPSMLHIVKRPTSSDAWDLNWAVEGTHAPSSLNSGFYTMLRHNLNSFSQFGIASPSINPLPIELTFFNANCIGDRVELQWQTASEQNSYIFKIERSTNVIDWEAIGELDAAGNSTSSLNYVFQDATRAAGIRYYRLVQVDLNGEYEIFGPVAVDCDQLESAISFFPNPVLDEGYIEINTESDQQISIELTESSGKLISQKTIHILAGNSKIPVDLSIYTAGVYYFKIKMGNEVKLFKVSKL